MIMKYWKLKLASLMVLLFLLFGTSEVAYQVLIGNQEQGLYPADGDSISIPLMTGEIVTFFVLVFASIGLLMPNTKVFGFVGMAFLSLASLLTLSSAAEWTLPNHYLLSLAYFVDTGLLLALIIWSWKKRRSSVLENQTKQEIDK